MRRGKTRTSKKTKKNQKPKKYQKHAHTKNPPKTKHKEKGRTGEVSWIKGTSLANNSFACAKLGTWRLLYHVKSSPMSYLSQVPSLKAGKQRRESAAHHNIEPCSPSKALHDLQTEAQCTATSWTAQGNSPAGNHISMQVNVPA